jgi:hypothetical protein
LRTAPELLHLLFAPACKVLEGFLGNAGDMHLPKERAALIKLGTKQKNKHPQAKSEGVQITMVAGARNRRYLHLDFAIV